MKDADAATIWARKIYGSQSTGPFPNGIKLRLVPELTPMTTLPTRVKMDRLRTKQATFNNGIIRVTIWELNSLDYVSKELGVSLRALIMGIKSKDKPHLTLFHSIDDHWKGPSHGHVVTFIPQLEDHARMILTGLLTYLSFHHPNHAEEIATYFTASAVERAKETKWDPRNYNLITADDERLDNLLVADEDFDFSDDDTNAKTDTAISGNNKATKQKARPDASNLQSRTLYGHDEDSVSTLASTRTGRKKVSFSTSDQATAPTKQSSTTPPQDEQHSTVSSISQTIEDRFANMEIKFNNNMEETSRLLRIILNKQEALERVSFNQGPPDGQPVVTPTGEAGIPRDAGGGP
jgi:hypothetical protein